MTYRTDASYKDNIFRKDHYMIFAANRHLASIKPIKTQSTDELKPGQVMARNTSSGYFEKFSAVSGGSYDSACVIIDELSSSEATGTSVLRGVFGGELVKSALSDYDSNANTALGAKEITSGTGTEIVKF